MFLRVESVPSKILIGMSLRMSTAHDRSPQLWRSFMPNRRNIEHTISENVYSVQEFDQLPDFSINVSEELYTNWALKEVSIIESIPDGMTSFRLDAGLYAVFLHKGTPADLPATAKLIFQTWLPASGYRVENRPFFQVLTPAYKPGDPASQEEMYIPIALNDKQTEQ
jgi:AraC family transcriptional regulator